MLYVTSYRANQFLDIIECASMTQLMTVVTRVVENSANLLNLIVSSSDMISSIGVWYNKSLTANFHSSIQPSQPNIIN